MCHSYKSISTKHPHNTVWTVTDTLTAAISRMGGGWVVSCELDRIEFVSIRIIFKGYY